MRNGAYWVALAMVLGGLGCSRVAGQVETAERAGQASADGQGEKAAQLRACRDSSGMALTPRQWVSGNNTFTLSLLKQVSGATVLSGYSAMRDLGMAYEGACGETAAEMSRVFGFESGDGMGAAGLKVEQSLLSKGTSSVIVEMDNRVWIDRAFKVDHAYTEALSRDYGASFVDVDFVNAPEEARRTINTLVSEKTHERIRDLLAPGSITPLSRLVLTNAVYFRAPWKTPFRESSTQEEPFMVSAGRTVNVSMMHARREMAYGETDGFQAVSLPFENGGADGFEFLVILPKVGDGADVLQALSDVERGLSGESVEAVISGLERRMVRLSLPKFKVEATHALKPMLERLGMKLAFGMGADFSAIGGSGLFISEVVQKAFIEISEEGGEAAAATGAVVALRAARPQADQPVAFKADHPFIFAIIDRSTGMILFAGRQTFAQ